MSRRPSARRPPRLPDVGVPVPLGPPASPTARQRLVTARVTGRQRIGRTELLETMRRLVRGDERALLGLRPFPGLQLGDVEAATEAGWGTNAGEAGSAIDPDRTVTRAVAGFARVADVARRGGRVAFATTRPASLLPLHLALARHARAAGADVLDTDQTGPARIDGRSDRKLWWLEGVAVITDGAELFAGPGFGAATELLFHLARPDLVVADRAIAGGALGDGIETVAPAGFDALALGVAAAHGAPVSVVPLDDTRPPAAYAPLVRLVSEVFARAA